VHDPLLSNPMSNATEEFGLRMEPTGIVRLRWVPGLRITGSLAAAAMAAVDQLNDGCRRPLLVEMHGTDTPTREARRRFSERCTATRIALLGASAVDRVRASLAPEPGRVGYPVPTRFFTSESTAVEWLLEAPSPGSGSAPDR
jgi:hypothetical protein